MHSVSCKIAELNVPSVPLHVSGQQLWWSLHFLNITLPQWLLSSFGAKWLSFIKKQVLCFISWKWSAHHWDFLTVTITVFCLNWPGALPDDTICIWSAVFVSSIQVFVPHCSHNITQLLDYFQFWCSSHKFFYILITHITTNHQKQSSQVWQIWRY